MAVQCVYSITNLKNGKVYIGSARDKVKRWHRHRKMLRTDSHPGRHLQLSWNKYGPEAFLFEIRELVEDANFLTAREQFWIWRARCCDPRFGYNTQKIAGSTLGHTDSAATRRRKSEAGKRRALRAKQNGESYHSPDGLRRMREANLGHRRGVGRTMSAENKEKLRRVNIGNSNALGAKRSEEWKINLSNRMKRLNKDPVWKKMHSDRIKEGLRRSK